MANRKDSEVVNNLINSAWEQTELRIKFEDRLAELGISFNQAEENLEITYRTINGILDGSLERIDFLSLLKIAQFLDLTYNEVTDMYVKAIAAKHEDDLFKSRRRTYILNNFDLPALKTMGVIDSIRDFDHIESRLKDILSLDSIMDFDIAESDVVYSSSNTAANQKNRKYFNGKARAIFKIINNPNPYNRDYLIDYIPRMRWQSMDTSNGLINVIRELYNLGITVIFQPKTPSLKVRGATLAVNKKPCIVLTDYKGFYPTLWFALMHEIHHIIFDWSEILKKRYHLSDEDGDNFAFKQKEDEANDFARLYMFSKSNMEKVENRIMDRLFVKEYALTNHVHPSIVYANYAFANNTEEDNLWQKFRTIKAFPPIGDLLKRLTGGLGHNSHPIEFSKYYKTHIFDNNLIK